MNLPFYATFTHGCVSFVGISTQPCVSLVLTVVHGWLSLGSMGFHIRGIAFPVSTVKALPVTLTTAEMLIETFPVEILT